jgi:hypothetical protein
MVMYIISSYKNIASNVFCHSLLRLSEMSCYNLGSALNCVTLPRVCKTVCRMLDFPVSEFNAAVALFVVTVFLVRCQWPECCSANVKARIQQNIRILVLWVAKPRGIKDGYECILMQFASTPSWFIFSICFILVIIAYF